MRIGIDIRLIGQKRTGDEAVVFNLVKNFAEMETGHEFELFTDVVDEKVLGEIREQLGIVGKNNFAIVSLPTSNRFAWNFWTLPMYLKKNPVDVYHTQYITPFFVSKKIKIVSIVHDISFNFFPDHIKLMDLIFLKTLIPISLRRADKIVGVSKFTRDEILKYYKTSPDKVDYIYNAVGDEFSGSELSAEKLNSVRKKYALPEKFILYMGTLQPRKNIPQLIEAFSHVLEKLPEMRLVLCGNRSGRNFDQKIDQVVAKHNLENKVIFTGFVDDVDKAAIFASAKVFVFPSLYEGFGIPPLEAMSQGVPVLVSDIPSLKEVSQTGALYFDLSDVDDFSKKLYDISVDDDLRLELIRAGKQRVGFFSWKKSATKMLAIYEKLRHNG